MRQARPGALGRYTQWFGEANWKAAAIPFPAKGARGPMDCRLPTCRFCTDRDAVADDLCRRHRALRNQARGRFGSSFVEVEWLDRQVALPGAGDCRVLNCLGRAESEPSLCPHHRLRWREAGLPRDLAMDKWLLRVGGSPNAGVVFLTGLSPLLAAEIRYGLWAHTKNSAPTRWHPMWLRTLVKSCAKASVTSVLELNPNDRAWTPQPDHVNRIVRELHKDIEAVHRTRADTRDMGHLDPSYFKNWIDSDQMRLPGHTTHQARHTLATRLVKAGATMAHVKTVLGHVSERMSDSYVLIAGSQIEPFLQQVWVTGPGNANPGQVVLTPTAGEKSTAEHLLIDLAAIPTEHGLCTFKPVVGGFDCPFDRKCNSCEHFVVTGADYGYWKRQEERWATMAEGAPHEIARDYIYGAFEKSSQALAGLEKALLALGLLDQARELDLRSPHQDFFDPIWRQGWRAGDLVHIGSGRIASVDRESLADGLEVDNVGIES
jgi:hypothetical protein